MKNLRLMIAGIAMAASFTQAATVTATNEGRFDQSGANNTGGADANAYIAGQIGSSTYRNFFVFNLASLSGTVTSATLNLNQPSGGFFSSNATETFQLFDVSSTSLSSLQTTGVTGATGVFTDLGTGTLLGSATVSNSTNGTVVQIAFNASGLAAIQAALGGTFAVGGSLAGSGTGARFSFGNTNLAALQTLNIDFSGGNSAPPSGVPEPGTILTLGAGLLVVGVMRFRKSRA